MSAATHMRTECCGRSFAHYHHGPRRRIFEQGRWTLPKTASRHFTDAGFSGIRLDLRSCPGRRNTGWCHRDRWRPFSLVRTKWNCMVHPSKWWWTVGRQDVAGTAAYARLVARASFPEDGGRNHGAPFECFELTFFPKRQIHVYQCHIWKLNHTRVKCSSKREWNMSNSNL